MYDTGVCRIDDHWRVRVEETEASADGYFDLHLEERRIYRDVDDPDDEIELWRPDDLVRGVYLRRGEWSARDEARKQGWCPENEGPVEAPAELRDLLTFKVKD